MITCVDIFIELGAETVNIIINLRIKRDPGEGGAGGGGVRKNVLPGSDHHRIIIIIIIIIIMIITNIYTG